MTINQFSSLSKAAVVLAALSIAVTISTSSSSSINGVRTCSFTDYGALGFGGAAILVGAVAMIRVRGGADPIVSRFASALAIGIGIWRALYGLGVVGGPC